MNFTYLENSLVVTETLQERCTITWVTEMICRSFESTHEKDHMFVCCCCCCCFFVLFLFFLLFFCFCFLLSLFFVVVYLFLLLLLLLLFSVCLLLLLLLLFLFCFVFLFVFFVVVFGVVFFGGFFVVVFFIFCCCFFFVFVWFVPARLRLCKLVAYVIRILVHVLAHFYSLSLEASFYGDACRMIGVFTKLRLVP